MRKYLLFIGLLLLCISPLSQAQAVNFEDPAQLPPGRTDMPDKSQENDCDCCQKCKAAKRPHLSLEEAAKPNQKDACETCCERCGRTMPSLPQESPPDIIDKPK
jgi:hypothetical protein